MKDNMSARHTPGPCGIEAPHDGYNAQDGRRYCCFCGVRLQLRPQDIAESGINRATYIGADRTLRAKATGSAS